MLASILSIFANSFGRFKKKLIFLKHSEMPIISILHLILIFLLIFISIPKKTALIRFLLKKVFPQMAKLL